MKNLRLMCCAATVLLAAPAYTQSCAENFVVEGKPLLTAMHFHTSQVFPPVEPSRVVTRLNQAILAKRFSGIRIDRANGSLTALQDTSGSVRPQTLRVVARKAGNGTRVDAVFMIRAGQVASANTIRAALCCEVSGARG